MLFPEEDSPLLKAWIVKRLENTSDADADVLADYVLALLHSDDGTEDVKSKCMSEMGNFLTEDPSSFVNDLFDIIQYRSYLPGAAPPPKPAPTAALPTNLQGLGDPNTGLPSIPTGPSGGSARKRGFQDRGDFAAPTGRDQFQGGRQFKQPRRGGAYGGRKGYVDLDRPQSLSQDDYQFQNTPGPHALSFGQPGQVPQIPPFDPSNPLEAMRQLQQIGQQMGLSMPPFAGYPQQQQQHGFQQNAPAQQGRKGRCWDFDRKGFCPRGIKCKFEHSTGTEPVPYSLPTPQLSGHISLPGEGPFPSQFSSTAIEAESLGSSHDLFAAPFDFNSFVDLSYSLNNLMSLTQQAEYDPTSATLSPQISQFPQQQGPHQGNTYPNQNRNNRQGQQRRKWGQGRAPFSAEGPVNDRSQTKVVVESIPEENFDEDQVRNFFAQFGKVEEVTMMGYKRLAVVKFDNWASANAAYKSPKVIFDNRFVKVFWYKDEKHGDIANGGGGANGFKNGRPAAANGVKREDLSGGDVKMEEDDDEQQIDMEEFARRQEEAQRLHEEKTARMREIERQREELERRQKELQAKQAAERQRLMEKLARKNSAEAGGGGGAAAAAATTAEGSKTEALKATLARLKGEAEALGIDPDAQQQDDGAVQFPTTSYGGRGGRGGGGYYRGRGGYAPRGSAFRGGGGAARGRGNLHAAYAAFSLDNRPRTVAVSGVDFSAPEKDEALRRHLFGFGEGVTGIQVTPAVTHLSFSDRRQAELFYSGVKGGRIPGVSDGGEDGGGAAVEVSWVSGPAAALPGSTTITTTSSGVNPPTGGGGGDADAAMDDADAAGRNGETTQGGGEPDAKSQGHEQQQQQQQQESGEAKEVVDYDVAGENEWDE
ncbi:hypothetical protein KVR01_002060 [Diaporthe batatas]|uniref:uncharacterized protein n=1 Tax=Diaporthe batatas TaxID=748121 RepID=UPI001D041847|nr:uncharacterized protein KVR01_002060 [Diaporthe batatas]KAG8166371.1 hypothetical protein KVR01_002060 [Diaporthe batatas]